MNTTLSQPIGNMNSHEEETIFSTESLGAALVIQAKMRRVMGNHRYGPLQPNYLTCCLAS